MTYQFRYHVKPPVKGLELRESTNLNLSEDRSEQFPDWVIDSRQYDDQQRAHGKEGRGFDEHGGNGLVQPTDSSWGPRGSAGVPAL